MLKTVTVMDDDKAGIELVQTLRVRLAAPADDEITKVDTNTLMSERRKCNKALSILNREKIACILSLQLGIFKLQDFALRKNSS